jgi:hypothetical protein
MIELHLSVDQLLAVNRLLRVEVVRSVVSHYLLLRTHAQQALVLRVLELCLRPLVVSLLLQAHVHAVFVLHKLVGAEPLVEDLLLGVWHLPLFQVIVHYFIRLVKHRLWHGYNLLLLVLLRCRSLQNRNVPMTWIDMHFVWRVDNVAVSTVVHNILRPIHHAWLFAVDLLDLVVLVSLVEARGLLYLLRFVKTLLLVAFNH